jgi:hypothetical protein
MIVGIVHIFNLRAFFIVGYQKENYSNTAEIIEYKEILVLVELYDLYYD